MALPRDATTFRETPMRHSIKWAIVSMVLASAHVQADNAPYQISRLPSGFAAIDINNNQTLLGYDFSAAGRVSTWAVGGSVQPVNVGYSFGGINDLGVVTGKRYEKQGEAYITIPVAASPDGAVLDLANNNARSPYTGNDATAINNAGQAAGHIYFGSSGFKAVRWGADGSYIDLDVPGYNSQSRDINNLGQVVGQSNGSGSTPVRGFVADGQSVVMLEGPDQGLWWGAAITDAQAINDAGQVVGFSGAYSEYGVISTPFIWDADRGMRLLAAPGSKAYAVADSQATDINNQGMVVGNWGYGDTDNGAFLWTEADGMKNLDSLLGPGAVGIHINSARAINDLGQIVVNVVDGSSGVVVSYNALLSPVPEASSSAMMALGLMGLGLAVARARNAAKTLASC
jgi:probable HAF family extracellular repeat protein